MTRTRILSRCLWIWLAIVIVTLTGCMRVFQKADVPPPPGESSAFEEALASYSSGDFEGALARFRALSSTGGPAAISQKAKMGEIFCHMMLAKTQAEYQGAIDMWKKFGRTTKGEQESWAVTLTDPFVNRLHPGKTEPKMGTGPVSTTMSPEDGQPVDTKLPDQESKTRIVELTKKANKADQLQRQMNEIIKENKTLKEKIKALETIDQNIQRKKSEIETTDEQTQ